MNQVKQEAFGECRNHYYSDQEYVLNGVHYLMKQSSGRCYMLVESASKQAAKNGGLARKRVDRGMYSDGLQAVKESLAREAATPAKQLSSKADHQEAVVKRQAVEAALQGKQEELRGHARAAMEEHLAYAQNIHCLENVRDEYLAAEELGDWFARTGIITPEERKGLVDQVYAVYRDRRREEAQTVEEAAPPPDNFAHGPEAGAVSRAIYALGLALERECPDNDCAVFLNTFRMARSVDGHIPAAEGWARRSLEIELSRLYRHLKEMFDFNLAVRNHRQALEVRAALEHTPIGPELVKAGFGLVAVRICERLPYLVEKAGDARAFGTAVLATPAAAALLSSNQRRRLARVAEMEEQ